MRRDHSPGNTKPAIPENVMSNNRLSTYPASSARTANRTARPLFHSSLALLVAIGLVLAACSDAPSIAGPLNGPAALAKGTFDGPKSVPTRGRILFDTYVTGDQELYSILEDGSSIVRLTHSPGKDGHGAFSPDARKIAFVSERDGTSQLYVMNPDGSGIKRLTNLTGGLAVVGRPSWSPDGKRLALAIWTDATNQEDIFVMSASGGTAPVLIASGPSRDLEPAYSPDGTRLAFTSDRTGSDQIWMMNADGSDQTQFLNCAGRCYSAAWSPDGARIATSGEYQDLMMVQVNLVETKAFVLGLNNASLPVWAPDGVKLAIHNTVNGENETAIVNADGSNRQNITNFGVHSARASSWGR